MATIPIIQITNASTPDLPDEELVIADMDPHTRMLERVAALSKGKPQKNLEQVIINPITRKKKVVMIMTPFWSPDIAPYNIARLTALAKASGFESRAFDLNIVCYHHLGEELWSPYTDWKWEQDVYWTEIQPVIGPYLDQEIDKIVEFGPDIAGFSLYYTNNNCASYVIQQLKNRIPGIKILGGGSQAIQEKVRHDHLFDHIVSGEGEQLFLQLLENIESGAEPLPKFLKHSKEQRIDLDSMPWPDYSDLPLDYYRLGTSVGSEISRGCIAKCQFCSETTFWRYRGRLATNIVDEIEYQYKTFGVRTIWFIDSLVNGNLKELRSFALGVVAKGMHDLRWLGYCRCDHRMDLDYFRDLKASGCDLLNFGVESGSQKVLDIMKKNVKVHAIEQNLRDITIVDVKAFTNWFVGFPGEEYKDFADTMALMWRTRHTNIIGYAVQSCVVLHDTPLYQQRELFGIDRGHFGEHWVTTDYRNTVLHRIIRLKSINIMMNHMRRGTDRHRIERPGIENHYTFEYNNDNAAKFIPYEKDFDFRIIKTSINPMADSLVNEMWPLLRTLWLAYGQYEITVNFDHDTDVYEFGPSRTPTDKTTRLNAKIWFKIDSNGDYHSQHYYDVEAKGPNGNPDMNGFDYGFRLGWEGRGNWSRPVVEE
jgi:anaerobic magnesium-protoporphyrin IX monomethyl ester cyclase